MGMTLGKLGVEHGLRLWPQQQPGNFCSAGFQKLVKSRDVCINVWGGGWLCGTMNNLLW